MGNHSQYSGDKISNTPGQVFSGSAFTSFGASFSSGVASGLGAMGLTRTRREPGLRSIACCAIIEANPPPNGLPAMAGAEVAALCLRTELEIPLARVGPGRGTSSSSTLERGSGGFVSVNDPGYDTW